MRRIVLFLALIVMMASVLLAFGQNNSEPPLLMTIDNQTCSMVIANASAAPQEATNFVQPTPETSASGLIAMVTNTPRAAVQTAATPAATVEATPEVVIAFAGVPILVPGDDCATVIPLLHVPSNDILWVALTIPSDFPWQQFQLIPSDPNPPTLDRRGRFIGCANPTVGEQTCRVLWDYLDATYQIEIPITVRNPYVAPPLSTPLPISTPSPINNGVWGDCGSCKTCGGPVEHCVLSPDNMCLWDAERCEPKGH